MGAYQLALREPAPSANPALQPLKRACHFLRTAPCLGRWGGLCIGDYEGDGVLWCGPCKMMAPVFHQAAQQIEPRARLLKVDTEAEQAIAAQFGIRSIPTLMVFSGGREIGRIAGAMDQHNLLGWINQYI